MVRVRTPLVKAPPAPLDGSVKTTMAPATGLWFSSSTWTTGARAVRWRMLLVAPSPSTTTRFSIGAAWVVAGIQRASKIARRRMATSVAIMARVGGWRASEGTGLPSREGGWRGGSGACMDGGADAPVRGRPPGRPIAGRLGTNSASEERVQGVRPTNSAATGMSYSNVMWMRAGRWGAALGLVPLLCAAAPPPAAWVPVRWPWADAQSLELLVGTPVNCLLLKAPTPELVAAAQARGVVALGVVTPGGEGSEGREIERALAAKVDGIVLEGEFPEGTRAGIQGVAVIELTARGRLPLGSPLGSTGVIGTYQGVWPGIALEEDGAKKSGPTSSVWIDTNTGFLRAVRAWGSATLWIANQPPPKTAVTTTRYLQAIADAGISGARWVVALDDDLAGRLAAREEGAMGSWKRIAGMLTYFEKHPEWRAMPEGGQLALVQDPDKGGLVSGGILDMIAVKHTPVRPIPRQRLSAEALAGATMAVDVDPSVLTAEQKEILRAFTRGGATLLNGPPGWKDPAAVE